MTYEIREGRHDELSGVLSVQHGAFARVARELGIREQDLPPLKETLADLESLFAAGTRFLVALDVEGRVIGSVRGRATCTPSATTVEVGRLVVDDDWVRRGVGSALMDALESGYPEATRFELFTGADACAPLALYLKRGYVESRREHLGYVELVWLERPAEPA